MDAETARKALEKVYDPELGYSIVELGLVYRVEETSDAIEVDFTLTSMGCPLAEEIAYDIRATLMETEPGTRVRTRLVWSPPWSPSLLSEEMRLELGYPL